MKIPKSKVKRLSYVVPGYIWRQGSVNADVTTECTRVITSGTGVILVGSPSIARREYALAWLLSQVLAADYHADIQWLSWFARTADEYTGAIYTPTYKQVMALSIKEVDVSPSKLDQVRDIVVGRKMVFVASSLDPSKLAAQLYLPQVAILNISANDSQTLTI